MTALWGDAPATPKHNTNQGPKPGQAAIDIGILDSLIQYAESWGDGHECDDWCDWDNRDEDEYCINFMDYQNTIEDAQYYLRKAAQG